MTAQLRHWWDGREPRERWLLGVLGSLVALLILVFLIILPVQSARAEARAELVRAQADAALVSRLVPSLGTASAGGRAPFDRSVLIEASRAQGIKLTRVQPSPDGAFAVWIDDAETQRLYAFFDMLMSDYAVTMERAVVSADATGRLSAQFTLR